jgi:protein N-terminal amidase
VTVSPTGTILQNYRKSFLYYTDETWAAEPPVRFKVEHLGQLGPVIQGICMDINPHRFLAPWSDYEFASAALVPVPPRPVINPGEAAPQPSNPLVVISMAWLSHLTASEIAAEPAAPDVATVAYWVERFQPIVERSKDVPGPWYVVLANRCGLEKSVCYAGSSTVIKVEDGGVSLFETCGRGEEKLCVVDLEGEPRFSVRSGR